jgi:hypothetical protein
MAALQDLARGSLLVVWRIAGKCVPVLNRCRARCNGVAVLSYSWQPSRGVSCRAGSIMRCRLVQIVSRVTPSCDNK